MDLDIQGTFAWESLIELVEKIRPANRAVSVRAEDHWRDVARGHSTVAGIPAGAYGARPIRRRPHH
jgi:hypothetical protein